MVIVVIMIIMIFMIIIRSMFLLQLAISSSAERADWLGKFQWISHKSYQPRVSARVTIDGDDENEDFGKGFDDKYDSQRHQHYQHSHSNFQWTSHKSYQASLGQRHHRRWWWKWVRWQMMFLNISRSSAWLFLIVKVCISPEEDAFASKAREIYMFVSFVQFLSKATENDTWR